MARFWCILLCALISAVAAFLFTLDRREDRTALARSAVKVKVGDGHGSGVNIGNRFIVTAAHVIGSVKEVTIKNSLGGETLADVLWTNEAHDIALLRARDLTGVASSPLYCDGDLEAGQKVEAIGNPGILEFVHSYGHISSGVEERARWKQAYISTVGIAPGSSGGPVYDVQGRVVGIAVGIGVVNLGMFPAPAPFAYIVPAKAVCLLLAYPRNDA